MKVFTIGKRLGIKRDTRTIPLRREFANMEVGSLSSLESDMRL
jgi:hypothetical protein